MSNNATENSASRRIATVLDEGSFVEIGGAVTARNTDFNLQEKETPYYKMCLNINQNFCLF